MTSEYEKQALDFLKETGTKLKVEFLKHAKYWDEDETPRDIYQCTFLRGNRHYTFTFGQSISDSKMYKDRITKIRYYCDGTEEKPLGRGRKFSQEGLKKYCMEIPGRKPNAYDILTCLEKHDPETHQDFCDNFGYDVDSIRGLEIYEKVKDQYQQLAMMFSDDELDLMAEIQ